MKKSIRLIIFLIFLIQGTGVFALNPGEDLRISSKYFESPPEISNIALSFRASDGVVLSQTSGTVSRIGKGDDPLFGKYIDIHVIIPYRLYHKSETAVFILRYSQLDSVEKLKVGTEIEAGTPIGTCQNRVWLSAFTDQDWEPYIIFNCGNLLKVGDKPPRYIFNPEYFLNQDRIDFLQYPPTSKKILEMWLAPGGDNWTVEMAEFRYYDRFFSRPKILSDETGKLMKEFSETILQNPEVSLGDYEIIVQGNSMIFHYLFTKDIRDYFVKETEPGEKIFYYYILLGEINNHAYFYVVDFSRISPEEMLDGRF